MSRLHESSASKRIHERPQRWLHPSHLHKPGSITCGQSAPAAPLPHRPRCLLRALQAAENTDPSLLPETGAGHGPWQRHLHAHGSILPPCTPPAAQRGDQCRRTNSAGLAPGCDTSGAEERMFAPLPQARQRDGTVLQATYRISQIILTAFKLFRTIPKCPKLQTS